MWSAAHTGKKLKADPRSPIAPEAAFDTSDREWQAEVAEYLNFHLGGDETTS